MMIFQTGRKWVTWEKDNKSTIFGDVSIICVIRSNLPVLKIVKIFILQEIPRAHLSFIFFFLVCWHGIFTVLHTICAPVILIPTDRTISIVCRENSKWTNRLPRWGLWKHSCWSWHSSYFSEGPVCPEQEINPTLEIKQYKLYMDHGDVPLYHCFHTEAILFLLRSFIFPNCSFSRPNTQDW